MREQIDSNSQADHTDSQSTSKDTYHKKRNIRKEKLQKTHPKKIDDTLNRLTREERAKIQKEKNREAAQRSRDLHREYVANLQKEVQDLRHRLEISKKLCHRCSQPLQTDPGNYFSVDHTAPTDEFAVPCDFQKENEIQIGELQMEKNDGILDDSQYIGRVEDNHEESSYISMMLMVAMVAIVVLMTVSSPNQIHSNSRNLLELYSIQSPAVSKLETSQTQISQPIKNSESVSLIQWRGLDNQICLDSLMKVQPSIIRGSLRRMNPPEYEIDSGVLVCSYRMPKIYSLNSPANNSPLVKMFLLGSQIKEMLTASAALQHHVNKEIQLNGIYRLFAEIKTVDLVTQHNCLL